MADYWRIRQAVESQQEENARLQARNNALRAEVEDLKRGTAAIEERARSELGMIKKGETFYQVILPDGAASYPTQQASYSHE